jgi:hypothetical protein
MGKDLSKYQETLRCGTCRNLLTQSSKVNVNDYAEDFVFVNCDDCQKRYEEHNVLTPSFVICTCDKEPKELPLEMAGEELKLKGLEEEKTIKVKGERLTKAEKKSTIVPEEEFQVEPEKEI